MKQLILCLIIMNLTGCLVTPGDVTDFTYVPWIQTFQKTGMEGHTDPVQRKKDIFACGVDRNASLDDGRFGGSNSYPGESLQDVINRNEKVENCMESKGYRIFSYNECGPLKAPTGLCN